MFNAYFRSITGTMADAYFENAGIHTNLVRYQGRLIKPNPILGDRGVSPSTDGAEFGVYSTEQLQQYGCSIPEDSLIASLGAGWRSAILPDAEWEVSEDNGSTWVSVRIIGTPARSRTGRYGITFVGEGIGQ